MRRHILILGGTTEARQLASCLAERADLTVILSLAGRTALPLVQPVPVRRGGFGGAQGLGEYLRASAIDLLIDATHPYAAGISANAALASEQTGVRMLTLRRPAWRPVDGDRWTEVADAEEAVCVLGDSSLNVFLALGRQDIGSFVRAPQHRYLIRSVDPVEPELAVPHAHYVLARGPFTEAEDRQLLLSHSIDVVVAKNSGGDSTYSKIAAARALGVPVLLYRRPAEPAGRSVSTVAEALEWLAHEL